MSQSKTTDMLLGAIVADAACLGTHWIYDPARIGEIAARAGGSVAFAPVLASNYEGVQGYFAHGARQSGMLTQYGEVLLLAIRSMNAQAGRFDAAAYRSEFADHFGPGGVYTGYIDRPTRGALENISADRHPSGIDDDQNPAVARLPAIVAGHGDDDALRRVLKEAVEITNVNAVALAYAKAYSGLLLDVLGGASLIEALKDAAKNADPAIRTELAAAIDTSETDTTEFAGLVGRACHLPTAGPVVFHILKHSASFEDAVERNIRAAGDTAGRAIMIGAVMGAAHGTGDGTGIPLAWLLQLKDGAQIHADCARLGSVQTAR